MSWSVMQKDSFAVFKVKSQKGLVWSKYDSFYYILWTADPFATKLGLIVRYYKPECLMKELDRCVRGQGHSTASKCKRLFTLMLSSEMLNLILPNLVRWCIIMSQIVFQKYWFAVVKVNATVKDHVTKDDFLIYLLTCWSFCNLNHLVWWQLIMSWIVLWKGWSALLWSRSRPQERFRIPVNVHLNDISWTAEPFVTKRGMVMHYHIKFGSIRFSISEDNIWINSHWHFKILPWP